MKIPGEAKWPSFLLLFLSVVQFVQASFFAIDGHVTHGVNDFNGKLIVNFSSSSLIFSSFPPLPEIGVINPFGANASRITDSTPLMSLMATIDAFDFQTFLMFPPGVGPFNVPIAETPTFNLTSTSIIDRSTPFFFNDSVDPEVLGQPYLSSGADANITLREWNEAASRLSGVCRGGKARVRVQVQNALPNALYTLWDVGVLFPLTPNETVSVGPFGGIPNVLATDQLGRGSIVRDLNYCPFDKCIGAVRCTLSVSANYHFDHVVFGGAPTLDFAGLAAGHVAANQMSVYPNGDFLIQPQNKFRSFLW
eukprot:TRINITY_DN70894_c0_g1_i1.p1 TRINITY_DN70894_c0_g1~~TRINITY_DN70894_c0_g1_i1.p1  ORF type:complete len:308 (-),score=30.06 TRINITY_DN70894_c0_g1_i1:2495-3418(-)